MRARRLGFGMLVLATLSWVAAIAAAPSVLREPASDGRWRVAAIVYAAGAVVCHQRADRSFHTAGVQWPVCARCTGLYAGAAAGLLIWPAVRRRIGRRASDAPGVGAHRARRLRLFTLAITVPTLITVATGALGLFDPSNAWRAALAVPLGAWVAGVLAAVMLGDLQ